MLNIFEKNILKWSCKGYMNIHWLILEIKAIFGRVTSYVKLKMLRIISSILVCLSKSSPLCHL